MSMLATLAALGNTPAPKLYVDDVFQSFTRTGTGASQATTTNIDMTKGYTLWSKGRSGATDHAVYNSCRGVTKDLVTNSTAAETTQAQGLTAISSTGHTYGTLAKINTSAATYVDWVFREAAKFHKQVTVVKSAGSNATVDLSSLGTVGMVRVKRTDAIGSWYIWHRSLTAGKLLIGETTAAEATLGHITVSGTTLTLVNGVIADGTYHIEAYAHDTSADGIIQCGSYVGTGAAGNNITIGFEPQYILIKNASAAWGWAVFDTARGIAVGGNDMMLYPNTSAVEVTAQDFLSVKATGFELTIDNAFTNTSGSTYIYIAIRRPNKPPTTGTQVYNAIARTGTGAAATVTGVGFAPDLILSQNKVNGFPSAWLDRLRGATKGIIAASTAAEYTRADTLTSFEMDGFKAGADTAQLWINSTLAGAGVYINHFFRRAPGFFDEVCDTGTGSAHTISHNLTVTPELIIRKGRSGATQWEVYSSALANTEKVVLNSTAAKATDTTAWNSTSPTSTVFTVGTGANVNTNAATYVSYLFATLAGISKVGSYTGNGTLQTIACGFTTGARFVLIKRTDSTGDWLTWCSATGIVAGTDPHLSLNTTAAEVTTDDSIDPDASGFIVNQLAATNINVTSASYIYLSIA